MTEPEAAVAGLGYISCPRGHTPWQSSCLDCAELWRWSGDDDEQKSHALLKALVGQHLTAGQLDLAVRMLLRGFTGTLPELLDVVAAVLE